MHAGKVTLVESGMLTCVAGAASGARYGAYADSITVDGSCFYANRGRDAVYIENDGQSVGVCADTITLRNADFWVLGGKNATVGKNTTGGPTFITDYDKGCVAEHGTGVSDPMDTSPTGYVWSADHKNLHFSSVIKRVGIGCEYYENDASGETWELTFQGDVAKLTLSDFHGSDIECDGYDLELSLEGENTVEGIYSNSAIAVRPSIGTTGACNLTISGTGSLAATCNYNPAITAGGNITQISGNVTAMCVGGGSEGVICNGDMLIKGGSLVGTGGAGGETSGGLRVFGNLTVEGGSVSGIGMDAQLTSTGISVNGEILIKGGTVTAESRLSDDEESAMSLGIFAVDTFTISGGSVTAQGHTTAMGSLCESTDENMANVPMLDLFAYKYKASTDRSNPPSNYTYSTTPYAQPSGEEPYKYLEIVKEISIQDLINETETDGTLTLDKDYSGLAKNVTVNKGITIDLNGHTVDLGGFSLNVVRVCF